MTINAVAAAAGVYAMTHLLPVSVHYTLIDGIGVYRIDPSVVSVHYTLLAATGYSPGAAHYTLLAAEGHSP